VCARVCMFICSVACKVLATLYQPSAGDIESAAGIITADSTGVTDEEDWLARKLKGITSNLEEVNKLKNRLRELGVKTIFRKSNSVLCYFICSYEEQIWQLRCWYKSGRLQTLLESVFTLLVGSSDRISIDQLIWNQDNYNDSLLRLSQLKALGMCTADRIFTC
jgi:hypothetical protein